MLKLIAVIVICLTTITVVATICNAIVSINGGGDR